MASGASSSPALPVLSLAAVVVVLLLAVRGEARPPHPLRGVRPLAFDEGYAQIFGSSNLALLRDGRRVRLALDESTGELHLCRADRFSFDGFLLLLPRFRG
jgi:xyloglucan:xyloglucosyl transferase